MLGEADRWLVKGWSFAASNKGWLNQELGYQWLTQCYQPQTKPDTNTKRQLLIVDGHGSHLLAHFVGYCMTHNIDLPCLATEHLACTATSGCERLQRTKEGVVSHCRTAVG